MKGDSGVRALIYLDGLDISRSSRLCRFVVGLQQRILLVLQKSFTEPIVSDLEDILVVLSYGSLQIVSTRGFDPFLRVTILLLKEGEFLNWTLLPQLDKQALATVVLGWLKTIGIASRTLVLFQWLEADHINILSTVDYLERNRNYIDPVLLITAGSIL
ncbi:MAG: hypothetical protein UV05_C0059G0005 [candidate division CPR1 bacterium GW2011_GWA2_42_17]|uniref:Uncharacterized protein n=1 Tax=candidate division CPR1 bacterium GW2011_GWA2_42_17 TaxID=1618341 RepID=A0A0G0YX72_9BACT|nr:MAG: hypothetical protein UV05_C0059G0005 [candidate division CPR1 bacterium GW2011_GWA2_42_17]